MALFFITGTDTDIGKTYFTGLLAKHLQTLKQSVITQKWVQTGYSPNDNDIKTHISMMNHTPKQFDLYKRHTMPYAFKLPASAHLAAQEETTTINPDKLIMSLRFLEKNFNAVLVEGLGGICVPLTTSLTTLDVLAQLKLPTIIVIENKVGAINHAILTTQAIAAEEIPLLGFVINNKNTTTNPLILKDNPTTIKAFTGTPLLATIDYNGSLQCTNYFNDILEKTAN